MDRLLADLAYALRRLVGARGFTAVALLTLALGIGANTAIFGIVRAVLLRPLPYADADRVALLWVGGDRGTTTWLSATEVQRYGRETRALAAVGPGGHGERRGHTLRTRRECAWSGVSSADHPAHDG